MKRLSQIFILMVVSVSAFALSTVDQAYLAKGGKNWIKNGGAEQARQGWATYADAAGTSPVDCTGGTATNTWTVSTTTPLAETASFVYTHAASNRQGDGVSYLFAIEKSEQAKQQQVSFDYEVASGTFVAGVNPIGGATAVDSDEEVYLYDVTNAAFIDLSNKRLLGGSGAQQKFTATFQTAYNSTSYRLCFHSATTATASHTLRVDTIKVGPQIVTTSAPVTDWVAYTPTTTAMGTISNLSAFYKRVGDTIHVMASWKQGTASGTSPPTLSLPSGLSIDTTKVSHLNTTLGLGNIGGASSAAIYGTSTGLAVTVDTSAPTVVQIVYHQQGTAGSTVWEGTSNGANTNTWAEIFFQAPIAGWSTGNITTQQADDTRMVAAYTLGTSTSLATGGTTYDLVPTTVSRDTHGGFSGATYTVPAPGYYFLGGFFRNGTSNTYTILGYTLNGGIDVTLGEQIAGSGTSGFSASGATLVQLKTGDLIKFRGTCSNNSCTVAEMYTYIFRIGSGAQLTAQDTISAKYNITVTGTSVNGNTKLTFSAGDKIFDTTGMFDDANDRLIVPIPGKYLVCGTWRLGTGSMSYQGFFKKTGVSGELIGAGTANASNITVFSGCEVLQMVAGDYVEMWANASSAVTFNDNIFSATRIGN